MPVELAELQRNWDAFGRTDPLWAILTDPTKRHGRWDPAEFFATGRDEIAGVLRHVHELGVAVRRGRALDFGCGAGRLTQALCEHFEQCVGVDIAPSMIGHARHFNRYGDRCRYVCNGTNDLAVLPDGHFDFVYTFAVLQHMQPSYMKNYICEFMRVLAPGGCAYFQVPAGRVEVAFDVLPASGCRARIELLESPRAVRAGADVVVRARVANAGDVEWPAFGLSAASRQVRMGSQWLDEAGRTVVHNDGRAGLPRRGLAPGEQVELSLKVRAPEVPGRYRLEVDMLQEDVTWFKDRGSPAAQAPVLVKRRGRGLATAVRRALRLGRPGPAAPSTGGDEPRMEMHVLPESEVLDLVRDRGGRLVDVQSKVGGDYRHGYYYVTK